MSGTDTHEAKYHPETDTLEIPLEEVNVPCEECGSTEYPNYKWKIVTFKGVLCPVCMLSSMIVLTGLSDFLETLT